MFIISSTGHGWREIQDEWDFPRVERWIDYCSHHPPLQAMVAAYLGLNKQEKPMRITEENFGDFVRMLNADSQVGGHG
jgi:hypothetical protein